MNVLITGAGKGLGLALTKNYLAAGASVYACVRQSPKQANELLELRKQFDKELTVISLDVSEEETIIKAAKQLAEHSVQIDCIVNNAGILLGRDEKARELTIEYLTQSLRVNLQGPVAVTKHMLPLMKEEGTILNISSEAGSIMHAYGGDYHYGISKAALNMYTKQLSEEVKETGIQVLAVHPGWMQTDMGGTQAPITPEESAAKIVKLSESRENVTANTFFIDYLGKRMDF